MILAETSEEGVADVEQEDLFSAELLQEDGKVYLVIEEEKIDITEDFSDGEASGTFTCYVSMKYMVKGTVEEYEISLSEME